MLALRLGQTGTAIDSGRFQAEAALCPADRSVMVAHGQNEDEAMVGFAELSGTVLSYFFQACETMPAGGSKGRILGDAVEVGSSVVRTGLPAAGEAAPLLLTLALFITAGAAILMPAERRNRLLHGAVNEAESSSTPQLIAAGK